MLVRRPDVLIVLYRSLASLVLLVDAERCCLLSSTLALIKRESTGREKLCDTDRDARKKDCSLQKLLSSARPRSLRWHQIVLSSDLIPTLRRMAFY